MALESALDLVRRLPPESIGDTLVKIAKLQPDLLDDLLSEVDQPLKTMQCTETKRDFLICDHNRDGDSFRSPWSNNYQPEYEDGALPSQRLRQMEVAANEMFDGYREAYYGGGGASLSSVFLWDTDDDGGAGFAGAVVIKKQLARGDPVEGGSVSGCWDSIHVLQVDEAEAAAGEKNKFDYTLTTSLLLFVQDEQGLRKMHLAGKVSDQVEEQMTAAKDEEHIVNIGNLIQRRENRLRGRLDQVYFGKAQEITGEVRSAASLQAVQAQGDIASALAAKLKAK